MKGRHQNLKRVVKAGNAFTESSSPLGRKEIELAKSNREHQVEQIDRQIAERNARKEALRLASLEDDKLLAAIDSKSDYTER